MKDGVMAGCVEEDFTITSSSGDTCSRDCSRSVVEDQGMYTSTCGYCKATSRTSVAQGLWAYNLKVEDYQDLLDRGWRRSGMFLYKPNMKHTCCPPYTIRLNVESFEASKDQMQVLRRMQRYLSGQYEGPKPVGDSESNRILVHDEPKPGQSDSAKTVSDGLFQIKEAIEDTVHACVDSGVLPLNIHLPKILVKPVSHKLKSILQDPDGAVEFTSNVAFSLAALLKREQGAFVQSSGGPETPLYNTSMLTADDLAEVLATRLPNVEGLHGFKVKACKGHLNFVSLATSELQSQSVTKIDQTHSQIKSMSNSKIKTKGSNVDRTRVERQLEVSMRRSTFDAEEFSLYKKYQVHVHKDRPDDVKESSFRRFLVESPLTFVPAKQDGSTAPCGFGSFHQQYRIDGRLVAVGVVDILPKCLSSKYLFWDPDYSFLSLGKFSALQELKWVHNAHTVCSSLEYYYLGFYIHSCPKMRYKAAYRPSELLCPELYTWVPYDTVCHVLDKHPYACLSEYNTSAFRVNDSSRDAQENGHKTQHAGIVDDNLAENAMEYVEWDFNNEDRKKFKFNNESERDATCSGSGFGDVLLSLNGTCLRFKVLIQKCLFVRSCVEIMSNNPVFKKQNEEHAHFSHLWQQLEAMGLLPHWQTRAMPLIDHLRRYVQAVGSTLASRMAYVLA